MTRKGHKNMMNDKAAKKLVSEFMSKVHGLLKDFTVGLSSSVEQGFNAKLEKALGTAPAPRATKKAKAAATAAGERRGAPSGVQPCKLCSAPSKGPRFGYLCAEHIPLKGVLKDILAARPTGVAHPQDPCPDRAVLVAESAAPVEQASAPVEQASAPVEQTEQTPELTV